MTMRAKKGWKSYVAKLIKRNLVRRACRWIWCIKTAWAASLIDFRFDSGRFFGFREIFLGIIIGKIRNRTHFKHRQWQGYHWGSSGESETLRHISTCRLQKEDGESAPNKPYSHRGNIGLESIISHPPSLPVGLFHSDWRRRRSHNSPHPYLRETITDDCLPYKGGFLNSIFHLHRACCGTGLLWVYDDGGGSMCRWIMGRWSWLSSDISLLHVEIPVYKLHWLITLWLNDAPPGLGLYANIPDWSVPAIEKESKCIPFELGISLYCTSEAAAESIINTLPSPTCCAWWDRHVRGLWYWWTTT